MVARCGIYEDRPESCRTYPDLDRYQPPECTFTFVGNERRGDCSCDVGACCAMPRDGGEPSAPYLPELAGGLPCKHLQWVEEEKPKEKLAVVNEPLCSCCKGTPALKVVFTEDE